MKKLIAIFLCLAMLICALASCSDSEEEVEDMGAYVHMYLADPVYNFDPAFAYGNESALKIVSLLYENLFVLGDDGKPEMSLAKSYKIDKKENTMSITLRKDAFWTDGTAVSANDVVFAWQRILDSSRSFDAAVLLYDVKNAKACKEGDVPSIDDVGIEALNKTELLITFEENVDYDKFLVNLTSFALCPLRSDVLESTEKEVDWAKSTTTMETSGPFRVRTMSFVPGEEQLILERNTYYRRDYMKDKIDKSVKPYRLIVDYTKSGEEILTAFENGEIFYVGDIPLSARSKYTLEQWAENARVTDAMSTHSYMFNTNAVVRYYNAGAFSSLSGDGECTYASGLVEGTDGDKIFAKAEVRQALSMALDRTEISKAAVFAEPANGLVPNGVFNALSKKSLFRDNDGAGLSATADLSGAKALLASAGVTPSKYMFSISVAAYDEVHMEMAKKVQEAWGTNGLGFNVAINAIGIADNKDKSITTGEIIGGIKDDLFAESYTDGKYDVVAIDYTALSPDAFSVLSVFAKGYSGGASLLPQTTDFFVATHASGYNSEEYNAKIDAAYAEKDLEARAVLLHEAEDILMKDLPIIPIAFNKNVVLESKEFKKVAYNYYDLPVFLKTKLKDYERFTPVEE